MQFERKPTLLTRKYKEYLLPTLMTTMAVSMATIVDSIIVGNLLGELALSAVGLSGPVIYCINMVFMLFGVGGVTLASIAKGRRDSQLANKLFTLCFAAGVAVMLLLVVVTQIFMQPITMSLAKGNVALQQLASAYLIPVVFVGPVMMIVSGMAQFLRTDGLPKTAANIMLLANAVNLVLDYVLIKFLNTGIAGAAVSTVVGYACGVLLLIPYLRSKERTFSFTRVSSRDLSLVLKIVNSGAAKALTQGLSFVKTLVINFLVVGLFGPLGVTAVTICINGLMVASMFISGSSDTLLPIVGTLFGERDYRGIRISASVAFRFMIVAVAAVMAAFLLVPGLVCQLFGVTSAEGAALSVRALRFFALSLPLYGVNQLLLNFYQTTGRGQLSKAIAILSGLVFIVGFMFLLSKIAPDWIWLSYVLAEGCTLLVVLVWGRAIARKEQVAPPLLVLGSDGETGAVWDVSIPATQQAALAVPEQVAAFCREQGIKETLCNRVALAVGEMTLNIAQYGHKSGAGAIDVLLRITQDKLLISIRDDGVPFDPTAYAPGSEEGPATGGIQVVKRIATCVQYDRPLGFNSTLITIGNR